MDIPDGNLVRLAREGDPAAFRLLVERHLPMARARAARLCPQPDDADDAVQDAFLQAFLALGRLRDPDRFAGWLGGIVANVCRAQRRRAPLTLLGDWPENLHPASAGSLPSAEDLDRADALGRAVAGLPPGQRQAVTAFYYADQPAGQVGATPGAAKASLHKARRRLREYITAHRPDLIPAVSRRIPMTAVRIAHADPWPGRTPDGRMDISHVLVILADDAGHRALPVRLRVPYDKLWRLLSRPDDLNEEDLLDDDHAEEATGRLLQAAGVTLAGVTVTDLGPGVTATRIGIAGPGGTRPVTASLADGLTLAVITGAPLAVDNQVMARLARPAAGPDLLSQFRSQETSPRPLRRRFEPRNMTFTDGLDRWQLGGTFLRQGTGFDYSATTEDGRAILAAAVPSRPDSPSSPRKSNPTTTAAAPSPSAANCAPPRRMAAPGWYSASPAQATPGHCSQPAQIPGNPVNHFDFATGTGAWTQYEVTAQIPADANLITFGVFLNGGGQLELRHPELAPHPPGQQ